MALGHEASRKRGAWHTVFVCATVLFVASLIALGAVAFSYFQGQQKYGELSKHLQGVVADDEGEQRFGGLGDLAVDWVALRAVNPDVVAWVYIPGTNINYPVAKGPDNEYYLTHDFEGAQGWLATYGAIFMDYRNNPDWRDQAYFLYGHHMNDGSMFAGIAGMADQERFDSARTVYLLSPRGNFELRSFALVHCDEDDPLVQIEFSSKDELTRYIQDKVDRSVVNAGTIPPASSIDKVFAFATCDNRSAGRYVLYAYTEEFID